MASLNDHENRINKIETQLMKTYSYTKAISITAGQWASTGIRLPETGTYIVKMYVHSANNGGYHWFETYSGICSYFSDGTNNESITETPLTSAGHAANNRFYTIGFKRVGGNTLKQEIVISSTENVTDCEIQFVFRRVL